MLRPALLAAACVLVLAAARPAAPAAEGGFTLLIHERADEIAARRDPARAGAYWRAWSAYAGGLAQAGVLAGGTALEPQPGERESLGGYMILAVPTRDSALAVARRAPIGPGGRVEVRAHAANPTMPR